MALDFIPEFNCFNTNYKINKWNNIGIVNYEINNLDIFKPYKDELPFKKRRLLNRLSKLGLHYPVPKRYMYIYEF